LETNCDISSKIKIYNMLTRTFIFYSES